MSSPKSIFLWVGRSIAVAGVVFVSVRLARNATEIDFSGLTTAFWLSAALLVIAYGLANSALARAWWCLLNLRGESVRWPVALRIYAASQVAKYVPGNVFQFVGRQALGVAEGIDGTLLVRSAVQEIALLACVAAFLSLPVLPLVFDSVSPAMTLAILASGTLALGVAAFVVGRGTLLAAVSWDSVFFVVAAASFVTVLFHVDPKPVADLGAIQVGSAFVAAWLIGFLTPGAPAGLGARELALVFLLGSAIPEPQLLMAVALSRMVTVLGDLQFAILKAGTTRNRKA